MGIDFAGSACSSGVISCVPHVDELSSRIAPHADRNHRSRSLEISSITSDARALKGTAKKTLLTQQTWQACES